MIKGVLARHQGQEMGDNVESSKDARLLHLGWRGHLNEGRAGKAWLQSQ